MTRPCASTSVARLVKAEWLEVIEDHRFDKSQQPSRYRFIFKTEMSNNFTPPKTEVSKLSGEVSNSPLQDVKKPDTIQKELNRTQHQANPLKRTEEEIVQKGLDHAADRVTKQNSRTNGHGYRKSILADIEALRPAAEHVYTNARYCGDRLDYQMVGLYVTCKHLGQTFTTPLEWIN